MVQVQKVTTIKNLSNGGEASKQYVRLLKEPPMEDSIHIERLVMLDSLTSYGLYRGNGFVLVKTYKDACLMRKTFIIKVSSFNQIAEALKNL